MLPGEGERRRHFMSLLTQTIARRVMEPVLLGHVLTLGLCLNEYYTRYNTLPTVFERRLASLTGVQREILGLVARGESDKRIANLLRISSHAVDCHVRELRYRFAVRNRVQLAQAASCAVLFQHDAGHVLPRLMEPLRHRTPLPHNSYIVLVVAVRSSTTVCDRQHSDYPRG